MTSEQTKNTLLLLHGALASKAQFNSLISELSTTHNILSFNFEGHGGEPIKRDFSIDHFVENLISFLDEQDLNNVFIFGYSMGGYVALKASLRTDRIAKIVTLATKFDWGKDSTAKEVKMLNPDGIQAHVPHYAESLRNEHAPIDWKEVVRQTAVMMTKLSEGERLTAEHLGRIQLPVTIGIGDQDKMVSIEESTQAASRLGNAEMVVLEGVQHPLGKMPTKDLANYINQSI